MKGRKTETNMTTEKEINLTDLLLNASRECWLALNEEQSKIVGRGSTIKEAVEEAGKNGVGDPIIMWSPKAWTPRVYSGRLK
jgi:hypothetical protein